MGGRGGHGDGGGGRVGKDDVFEGAELEVKRGRGGRKRGEEEWDGREGGREVSYGTESRRTRGTYKEERVRRYRVEKHRPPDESTGVEQVHEEDEDDATRTKVRRVSFQPARLPLFALGLGTHPTNLYPPYIAISRLPLIPSAPPRTSSKYVPSLMAMNSRRTTPKALEAMTPRSSGLKAERRPWVMVERRV